MGGEHEGSATLVTSMAHDTLVTSRAQSGGKTVNNNTFEHRGRKTGREHESSDTLVTSRLRVA